MQDHKITLFHANWSFCSQMVRVALFELNIKFDERHIKLCDQYAEGENLDKIFLDINPLATVPVIKINNEVIVNSTTIIEELNKRFQSNLCIEEDDSVKSFVKQTTITEGDKFASTIGTIIPVFSAPLIEFMIRKLPLKSIIKIFMKHPRKDRKMIFLSMYFFGVAKKFPNIAIKKFADELIKFEELLNEDNTYFYRMTGELSLENNGGFIQFRTKLENHPADKSFDGVRIRVRGNDNEYSIHIRTKYLLLPWQYYESSFKATNQWTTIELPFSSFNKSNFYQPSAVSSRDIKTIGIVAIGREFNAEIDLASIELY